MSRASSDGQADRVVIELAAAQTQLAAGIGRVVATGEHSLGLLDRQVLVGPIDPCGECDTCRAGGAAVCPVAIRRAPFTEPTVSAAGRWLVPLGDGLELVAPAAAAVAGDVALAYTLYARTGVGPRDPVVVIGATPIARFLIEILVAKGIRPIAITTTPTWSDWLAGKRVAACADRATVGEALAAQSLGTRPWRILCADPAATDAAFALAGPRAQLTLLAGANRPIPVDALAREVSILGVAGAHPDLVVEAAALCVKGDIDLAAGTTETADQHRTQIRRMGQTGTSSSSGASGTTSDALGTLAGS